MHASPAQLLPTTHGHASRHTDVLCAVLSWSAPRHHTHTDWSSPPSHTQVHCHQEARHAESNWPRGHPQTLLQGAAGAGDALVTGLHTKGTLTHVSVEFCALPGCTPRTGTGCYHPVPTASASAHLPAAGQCTAVTLPHSKQSVTGGHYPTDCTAWSGHARQTAKYASDTHDRT